MGLLNEIEKKFPEKVEKAYQKHLREENERIKSFSELDKISPVEVWYKFHNSQHQVLLIFPDGNMIREYSTNYEQLLVLAQELIAGISGLARGKHEIK